MRRSLLVASASLLLLVVPSCRTEQFDLNGDGNVTFFEAFESIVNWLCGDNDGAGTTPDDGSSDDGSGSGGATDDGTGTTPGDGSTATAASTAARSSRSR